LKALDPNCSNVFFGSISGDRIVGNWYDIPKSKAANLGQMELKISANGRVLEATRKRGPFGGSRWTKSKEPGIVIASAAKKPCTLVLTATGPRVDVAPMFRVTVRGPDDPNAVRDSGTFNANRIRTVDHLAEGSYQVSIDTKAADMMVGAHPGRFAFKYENGGTHNFRIEFK
jgi:hypothetical protein